MKIILAYSSSVLYLKYYWSKAWFPFGLLVLFVARLCFFLPVLVFPAPLSVVAFAALRSFLLLFIAFRCTSLLFLAFHCSWYQPPSISPELVRMNENGNEKCSLLLFVAHFGFWFVFPFAVRCLLLLFVALSCFFEINSISKTKTGKCLLLLVMAFCCSFWSFVDVSIWASHSLLWLFASMKNQNEQQKAEKVQMETRLNPNRTGGGGGGGGRWKQLNWNLVTFANYVSVKFWNSKLEIERSLLPWQHFFQEWFTGEKWSKSVNVVKVKTAAIFERINCFIWNFQWALTLPMPGGGGWANPTSCFSWITFVTIKLLKRNFG